MSLADHYFDMIITLVETMMEDDIPIEQIVDAVNYILGDLLIADSNNDSL